MKKLHRSAGLTKYVELAQALNISPMEQLRRVNISTACLTNPDTMIPVSALCQLLENSAQAAGVDNFGLRMAEERELSNLGPLALVIKAQPTLRKALDAMRNYVHLQDEAVMLLYEENNGELIIRQEFVPDHRTPIRQATELALGVIYRTLRVLLGKGWRASAVCFRHSPPRDLRVHRRIFDTHLEFNSEIDGIICHADELDLPLPNYEPEFARYMQRLLDLLDTKPAHSATDKVRQLIWLLMPSGRCSLKIIAQHLGVDLRTLQRHLQRDGQSFSDILDDARSDMAMKYLTQYDRPVRDLAELLGFSEPSAFSRWFARRFGCSPTAWRQDQGIDRARPLIRQ